MIVGGGFAGLEAVRALRKAPVEVLMIDRTNYHTFQPLLYQVATAGLEPGEIAHTVRGIFQTHLRFRFRMGTVTTVDPDAYQVRLSSGEAIGYDYLIIAAGAEPEFFGVEGAGQHAFTLKTLGDATRLRSHLLRQFERAAQRQSAPSAGRLNVTVVGGGPTGVEMAGALVELIDTVLAADFPEVDPSRAQVTLVEMAPHLLGGYDASLRDYALDTLRERGVEVVLVDAVERVAAQVVLHIWELIGFRNRLVVMLDWIYNYFAYDRSARLIFERGEESSTPMHQSAKTDGQRV